MKQEPSLARVRESPTFMPGEDVNLENRSLRTQGAQHRIQDELQ